MTIVIFIIFLAILIIGHEFGHFIVAKLFKLRVDEFGFGFPPKLWGKKIGETEYTLNLIPFGGFVKIYGENHESSESSPHHAHRAFYLQPLWKRGAVLFAGVIMNFLIGWIALSLVFAVGIKSDAIYISNVVPNSPAAEAGFKPGDTISGFSSAEEFSKYIENNAGKEIVLDNKSVTPRTNPPAGEGRLGIEFVKAGVASHGFFESLYLGFLESIDLLGHIFIGLINLIVGIFTGSAILSQVTGPVGIFNMVGEASQLGIMTLIQFLGILSLNLSIFNLIPIPALDGGRLLFLLIELVTRKKIGAKQEQIANMIGFGVLMLLAVLVTFKDVVNIIHSY